jgi:MOSC domain-containing protein YiiM
MQLNIMNVRAIAAISPDAGRWPLAGDQLYLDLDISVSNLPPGTRLAVGDAVIEVTAEPHTGCAKFTERFGLEAMRWVNSAEGKALRLRGMNARVVRSGTIRVGDTARKLAVPAEV